MHECSDGNWVMVHLKTMNKEFLLVSVYGPNKDDPNFYNDLENRIKETKLENVIIGGDWNLVMDPHLDYDNYKHVNNTNARERVLDTVNNLELVDIWRELNPVTRRYTWCRNSPLQQSRLDFFLISDLLLPFVSHSDITPGYKTDHSIITINLQLGPEIKRNSFWKFNSSLLKDKKYVDRVNDTIESIIQEYAAAPYRKEGLMQIPKSEIELTVSDHVFLDFMLTKIREITISYATFKKREQNKKEKFLEDNISKLEQMTVRTEDENKLLQENKEELEKIREKRMEGVILRSRARWFADGEKITKYFCSLEKRNYISKNMNSLIKKDGSKITDCSSIVEEVTNFYKNLYKQKELENVEIHDLVKNLPSLSNEESFKLEGEITLDEASFALKNMKNYKSPGTDGFTTEFFKFFWLKLGPFVVRTLNDSFRKGELSITQKQGIIVCLPKGDKSREYLTNWRPITLLNVVYKIGSTCIANRLKLVLPKLVDEDQTGFIKGRFLGDNIRLLYDTISFVNDNNLPGLVLSLDFEKAFDSVDWGFMEKVLHAFGFGNDIIRWINTFYKDINAYVMVNGQLSKRFSIKRGCRQGDPISPYLFILCAEILATMIRENDCIKGIIINNHEYKISQYADDTELFQNGDKQSFEETFKTIDIFSKHSGLNLNSSKTCAVWLGCKRHSSVKFMQHLGLNWNPKSFKILGIMFNNDLTDIVKINTQDKLVEVKQLFKIWSKRQLTPLGRIAVLKSLILSKLVHLWIFLPNPPDHEIDKIQKLVYDFVWENKRDKISRKVSNKNMLQGGLGIPNIKEYIKSLKISWIRKLKYSNSKWKYIILSAHPQIQNIDSLGPQFPIIKIKSNNFWINVFQAYADLSNKISIKKCEELLAERIFYNEKFKLDKKTFFYSQWFDKGVYCLGHFITEDGKFLLYNEFCNKYNINTDFLTYAGCIDTLKKYLRSNKLEIKSNSPLDNSANWKLIQSVSKGARTFYDVLMQSNTKPNCCAKWENKLNGSLNWKTIFKKVKIIPNIKIKWFQTRILHRILGTNIILEKMLVKNNNLCSLCQKEKENIQHLFWKCEFAQTFWRDLQTNVNNYCNHLVNVKLNENIVLLNYDEYFHSDAIFDLILTLAKYFIYKNKINNTIPNYVGFKQYLKMHYEIEKHAALVMMNYMQFKAKWTMYMPLFFPNTTDMS